MRTLDDVDFFLRVFCVTLFFVSPSLTVVRFNIAVSSDTEEPEFNGLLLLTGDLRYCELFEGDTEKELEIP